MISFFWTFFSTNICFKELCHKIDEMKNVSSSPLRYFLCFLVELCMYIIHQQQYQFNCYGSLVWKRQGCYSEKGLSLCNGSTRYIVAYFYIHTSKVWSIHKLLTKCCYTHCAYLNLCSPVLRFQKVFVGSSDLH